MKFGFSRVIIVAIYSICGSGVRIRVDSLARGAVPALWPLGIPLGGASGFSFQLIVHGTFAVASGMPGTWVVAHWRASCPSRSNMWPKTASWRVSGDFPRESVSAWRVPPQSPGSSGWPCLLKIMSRGRGSVYWQWGQSVQPRKSFFVFLFVLTVRGWLHCGQFLAEVLGSAGSIGSIGSIGCKGCIFSSFRSGFSPPEQSSSLSMTRPKRWITPVLRRAGDGPV